MERFLAKEKKLVAHAAGLVRVQNSPPSTSRCSTQQPQLSKKMKNVLKAVKLLLMAPQHSRSKGSLTSMQTQTDLKSLTELRLSANAKWSPTTLRRRKQTDRDKNRTERMGFKAGKSCTGIVALRAAPGPRRRMPGRRLTESTSR